MAISGGNASGLSGSFRERIALSPHPIKLAVRFIAQRSIMDTTHPIIHRGGCHCGRVRFEVDAPAHIAVLDCNCSICRMSGFLHLIVPAACFRLLSGADALTKYTFNTGIAQHRFCRHCGIKAFYIPRSNPDGVDVNLRCLDPGTFERVDITLFDDTRRAQSEAAIAHLSRAG
jgi:hypothetical protein